MIPALIIAAGMLLYLVASGDLGGSMSQSCCNAVLRPSEIAGYASSAGFAGSDLITAVAIAIAESGGKPGIIGDMNIPAVAAAGGSIGLWQINLHAHPEYQDTDLTDPQTNANAAFQIYQSAGNAFKPWSTFKNGAYLAYLNQASNGVNVSGV